MPCFTLTLFDKQKVYRLSDLIASQYDVDTAAGEAATARAWREVNIQASPENVDHEGEPLYIKGGCKELSGLRYGYVIAPGETKRYRLSSAFTSTDDKYFLSESADGLQMSVELI